MTQSICFNHLTKRVDDSSAKWQKSWEFLPESFLLSEEVLEQLKLVDAMEEVSGFFSSKVIRNISFDKNQQIRLIMNRYWYILSSQEQELCK